MKSESLPHLSITGTVLCLVVIGSLIRAIYLPAFQPIEFDEWSWLLLGRSLLTEGRPASWTIFKYAYQDANRKIIPLGGYEFEVVTPYLDHPPLFGLSMGIWSTLTGNTGPEPFNWTLLRLPMLMVAFASIGAATLFVARIFNHEWAIMTAFVFTVFPAHVLTSGFITPEHIFGLLTVTSLLCVHVLTEGKTRAKPTNSGLWGLLIAANFIAPLLKLSGIIVPLASIIIATWQRKYHAAAAIVLAAATALETYLIYGIIYSGLDFFGVLAAHGERPQSLWHFWTFLTSVDIGYVELFDPTLIVGLIGLFIATSDQTIPWHQRRYFFSFLVALAVLFMLVAPAEAYGWYKYSAYPFLAMGASYILYQFMHGRRSLFIIILPWLTSLLGSMPLLTPTFAKLIMLVIVGSLSIIWLLYSHPLAKRAMLVIQTALCISILFLSLVLALFPFPQTF